MLGLISDEYKALQKDLYQRYDYGKGVDAEECAKIVREITEDDGTVLDYGCGQGRLKALLEPEFEVSEYDPCLDGKDKMPARADCVVCADVLEHVEPDRLSNVLQHIKMLAKTCIVLVIATKPSNKVMADGRNAHLIVEDLEWWQAKLTEFFLIHQLVDRSVEGKGLLVIGCPWWGDGLLPVGRVRSIAAVSDEDRNEHVRSNCSRIKQRVEVAAPGAAKLPKHSRVACLVCYGPSLMKTWPDVAMTRGRQDIDIYSVSGAHKFLVEKGIIPYAHIDCDPRAHKATQIGEPHHGIRYWLSSCIHPSYLDKLEGHDVALWHAYNGVASRAIFEMDPGHRLVIGGGSVGLRAISLLYARGYRKFLIHGMDCSYDAGHYHAGPHDGKDLGESAITVKCGDRWFETSPIFILYARYFVKQGKHLPDAEFVLHGDGLLQYSQSIGTDALMMDNRSQAHE